MLATLIPTRTAAAQPGDRPVGPETKQRVTAPRLVARATLSADYLAEGPPSGSAANNPSNGRTPPYAGHVVPGFSGTVANDDGSFWAMPDNGFGTIENSADFLLRLYHIVPDWETADGGAGEIVVNDFISLRDPNNVIGFSIVNEDTPERLLTGSDLDIESVQRAPDGTFWIGEEFGPFIVHFDTDGVLLDAPIEPPFGMSPQSPHLGDGTPNVERSRGFEAMAMSPDGTRLYPIVEGFLTNDDDQLRRYIYEVDLATGEYTERSWQMHTEAPANLVADAQAIDDNRLLIIERDGFQWAARDQTSVRPRLVGTGRSRIGVETPRRRPAVDRQPRRHRRRATSGGFGLGPVFAFLGVGGDSPAPRRRTIARGQRQQLSRWQRPSPGTPDDTEMIILDLEATSTKVEQREPTVIAHRGASGYRPEHTLAGYELAIRQCADIIEPDVVTTSTGCWSSGTTTTSSARPTSPTKAEFADRRTTKTSTASRSPAGSPRTSPWPSCGPCGPRSACRPSDRPTPRTTAL